MSDCRFHVLRATSRRRTSGFCSTHSPRTKKVSLMCLSAAISNSLGVLVACGPSSKVIAIYGPSTLTSVNVIFSVLGGFGVGEVAANAESCASAGGVGRQDENESIYKRSDHKRDNERASLKTRRRPCRRNRGAGRTVARRHRCRCRSAVHRLCRASSPHRNGF